MTPSARSRAVVIASYVAVVVLVVPCAAVAERITGGVGSLLVMTPLLGWGLVATLSSGAFADHHDGLVWIVGVLLYLGAFSTLVLPVHFALRERPRAHAIAVSAAAVAFLLAMTLAWPVRGLAV